TQGGNVSMPFSRHSLSHCTSRFHPIVDRAFTLKSPKTPNSFPSPRELPAELSQPDSESCLSTRHRGSPPQHNLVLSRKIADLVEVPDVNWNRNIGRVAVVEEMLEADLHGNGTNEFAEAWRLEIFHAPDFQHERAEVFTDEGHLAIIQIYGVK